MQGMRPTRFDLQYVPGQNDLECYHPREQSVDDFGTAKTYPKEFTQLEVAVQPRGKASTEAWKSSFLHTIYSIRK